MPSCLNFKQNPELFSFFCPTLNITVLFTVLFSSHLPLPLPTNSLQPPHGNKGEWLKVTVDWSWHQSQQGACERHVFNLTRKYTHDDAAIPKPVPRKLMMIIRKMWLLFLVHQRRDWFEGNSHGRFKQGVTLRTLTAMFQCYLTFCVIKLNHKCHLRAVTSFSSLDHDGKFSHMKLTWVHSVSQLRVTKSVWEKKKPLYSITLPSIYFSCMDEVVWFPFYFYFSGATGLKYNLNSQHVLWRLNISQIRDWDWSTL